MITIPAGSTNVPVTSTTGFAVGQKIALGSGANLEVATVTAVGRPGTQAACRRPRPRAPPTSRCPRRPTSRSATGSGWTSPAPATGSSRSRSRRSAPPARTAPASPWPRRCSSTTRATCPFNDAGTGISFTPATDFAHSSNEPVQALGTGITLDSPLSRGHAINAVVRDAAVTTAGYQGTKAPNQWFGGPALSTSAGNMVLRDAAGNVADSLNYGLLVDPWSAEGYQGGGGSSAAAARPACRPRRAPSGAAWPASRTARTPTATAPTSAPRTAPSPIPRRVPPTSSRRSRSRSTASVGGSVPATLALTLGTPAAFGAFTPGVAQDLQRLDDGERDLDGRRRRAQRGRPELHATGHLVNGSFSLPQPLTAKASSAGGTGTRSRPSAARRTRRRCSPTPDRRPMTRWRCPSSRRSAPPTRCARAATRRR